ncbi:hypothetical protein FRC09_020125 [Ceratobasidium sp. 395]|nr:hypothetical protein FRC09_020125 [Ceratobasidium sp. 395]
MAAQRLSPSHPAYPLLVQVNTVIGQVTQLAGKSSRDAGSMSALLNGVMPQLEYLQSLGAYTDSEIERIKSLISQHSYSHSRSTSSRTSSSGASTSSRDSSPSSPSSASSHSSSQSRHHLPAYVPSREAPPTLGNQNNTRIVRQPDLHRVADSRKAARAAGQHVPPVGFQVHHPHSKRGESPLERDQNGFITPYNPIVQ